MSQRGICTVVILPPLWVSVSPQTSSRLPASNATVKTMVAASAASDAFSQPDPINRQNIQAFISYLLLRIFHHSSAQLSLPPHPRLSLPCAAQRVSAQRRNGLDPNPSECQNVPLLFSFPMLGNPKKHDDDASIATLLLPDRSRKSTLFDTNTLHKPFVIYSKHYVTLITAMCFICTAMAVRDIGLLCSAGRIPNRRFPFRLPSTNHSSSMTLGH